MDLINLIITTIAIIVIILAFGKLAYESYQKMQGKERSLPEDPLKRRN